MLRVEGREDLNRIQSVKILRQHMPELKERYNVTSLGLFGSYVRQAQRKKRLSFTSNRSTRI
ncbi:MAG TPA: hypothetical protein VFM04_03230 [Candidatus Methylomirabilis sp.]|nr:hypothetical protein [Candidatus Methylomirabilis sp.]